METAFLVSKKGVDWDNLNRYTSADGFHFHKKTCIEPYLSNIDYLRVKKYVFTA